MFVSQDEQQQQDTHSQQVAAILGQLKGKNLRNEFKTISLQQNSYPNLVRGNHYKKGGTHIDIGRLNQILEINVKELTAWVEPRVTMEELVDVTLSLGVLPPVVPEFKTITVGGAISGSALESSSHAHGQFNDTCLAYDVLLGNGEIVRASPEENADLFYSISGAYGSLGIILRVKLKLIPAKPWIELTYRRFDDHAQAVSYMSNLHYNKSGPEFIEGIVFQRTNTVVISAKFATHPPGVGDPVLSLSHYYSTLYFQHVLGLSETLPNHAMRRELIATKDYLFRHDRGTFWMGAYAVHGWLLSLYTLERFLVLPAAIKNALIKKIDMDRWEPGLPGPLFRFLFGWALSSKRLYKVLHTGNERWFEKNFVVQDFYIPEKYVSEFVHKTLKEYAITPLWLCPVKATTTPQLFSPHYVAQKPHALVFDVGVYGIPRKGITGAQAAKQLEKLTLQKEGRKMLYTHSFYSPEELWKIYSFGDYQKLRQKYHAEGVWTDFQHKVL